MLLMSDVNVLIVYIIFQYKVKLIIYYFLLVFDYILSYTFNFVSTLLPLRPSMHIAYCEKGIRTRSRYVSH